MPKNTPARIIDTQKTRAASFLGGGGGTAVKDHGNLAGLGDDDHPQYLLVNGTRNLAGNLAVDSGITIDGIDISAHAADVNAHHARSHAITSASDHTVTGSTAQMQAYIDANVVATVNSKGVNGKTLYSSGDSGGVASTVGITNSVSGTSTGTGTVKMNGATPRNSSGWLKIYSGTNVYYIPLFSTIDG